MADVIDSLGSFHIWISLFIIPIIILLLIATIVYVVVIHNRMISTAKWVSTTKCIDPISKGDSFACDIKVSLPNLPGVYSLSSVMIEDPSSLSGSSTFQVSYSSSDIQGSLSTLTISNNSFKISLIIISSIILIFMISWFVNFHFRNNKTFRKVSGVMEGVDLASSVFSGYR
jgi:hypothetical protein